MLSRLGRFCFRHRRLVVVAWLVALVAITVAARFAGTSSQQGVNVPGTEARRATELLAAEFPQRAGDSGQLVVHAARGTVDDPAIASAYAGLAERIAKVPGVDAVSDPFAGTGGRVARDRTVAYGEIQFAERASEVPKQTTDRVLALTAAARAKGLDVEAGGRMLDERKGPGNSELIGVVAAIGILLFAFGSVLAMGLPIVVALGGIGVGIALVGLLGHVMQVPDFTTTLAAMLGIGVGIDYALFIVTRYRQGLHDGLEPEDAVVLAMDTSGRAVVFAGATVCISLLGLLLIGVGFVQGLAVGSAIAVAVTAIAAVTLLPAMLGFVGRNVDQWHVGRKKAEDPAGHGIAYRWSRLIQKRPWPFMLGAGALLVVLAIPLFSMRMGFSDAGNNPRSNTTRRAYDLLADGFGPGFNGPLILAAQVPRSTDPTDALGPLATALRRTPGVASVGPVIAAPSGRAAVIQVIPTSSPQSADTVALVHRLRDDVIPRATAAWRARVLVGGMTASAIDFTDLLARRLPIFIGAVLGLSFLLLLAVFRSVLVPVKAVVMNLLSIGAAYGITVAVFQWGWGSHLLGVLPGAPIEPFAPMMFFAIVFGLSMDYEVFLLSRIREEYDRTGDNATAVADGLAATARVITAAAAIMVTVFASFVLGDERLVKLFGLGLATAVFLDATVVRLVLVPATMELLGDRNWWFPRWLERIVPVLHVEATPYLEQELLEEERSRQSVA